MRSVQKSEHTLGVPTLSEASELQAPRGQGGARCRFHEGERLDAIPVAS
jgi:hypothetical protein